MPPARDLRRGYRVDPLRRAQRPLDRGGHVAVAASVSELTDPVVAPAEQPAVLIAHVWPSPVATCFQSAVWATATGSGSEVSSSSPSPTSTWDLPPSRRVERR